MRALLLLTFLGSPAQAWDPIDVCNGGTYSRWVGPTTWQLTTSGGIYYGPLSNADVYDAMFDGFQVWSDASCCSDFQHQYGGDTTTGYSSNDNQNVIEFYENSWPGGFGGVNSTIAITLPQYDWNSCVYDNADQAYNAVGFNFTVTNSPGWNDTDLQSIAAHEHGHWLGLDHSTVSSSATMYASYQGGTGARTLHSDDETAVCTIYPGNCGPTEAVCDDGLDDDGDGLTDCSDSDCATDAACQCVSAATIACDSTVSGDNSAGIDSVQSWGCANWQTTGPESVYAFTSTVTGPVVIDLTNLNDDLDLFITDDNGGSCDPSSCEASGTAYNAAEQVTLQAVSGTTYQIVVDGWDGASSSFDLSTDCGGVGGPTPNPGTCAQTETLSCGTTVAGTNAGGSNDVEQYACMNWETTGPETVYELTPTTSGDVSVRVTGLTADLDLFVTTDASGACDPDSCLGASGSPYGDPEEVTFTAVAGTTYSVVVDGWDGATASFDIEASCAAAGTGSTGTGTGGTGTGSTGTGSGGTGSTGTGGTGTGSTATGTGGSGGTGTGGDPGGTDGPVLEDPAPTISTGCGCSQGGGSTGGLGAGLGLLALLGLRRRR